MVLTPPLLSPPPANSLPRLRSVGCTIIELLTGDPPYFELAPVSAMFRIVSDEHPPLPDGISPVRRRGGQAIVRKVEADPIDPLT